MVLRVSHIDTAKVIEDAMDRVIRCTGDMWIEGAEIEETPQDENEKIVFREFVATDALVECFTEIMKRPVVCDLNPSTCAYITYVLLQQIGIIRYKRLWRRYADWVTLRKIWVGVRKDTSAVPPFWRDQRGVKAWLDQRAKKVGRKTLAHYDAYIVFVCSLIFALTTEDGHLRPELIIGRRQRRVV